MKTIDTNLVSELGVSELSPFALLDMKIGGTHYRYTNCDIPITNLGINIPDPNFQSGNLGYSLGGFWNFIDGAGTTLVDCCASGFDMTASASAPLWNPNGKRGWCGEFSGNAQYYEVATSAGDGLNPANITVMCMVKPSNYANRNQDPVYRTSSYGIRITSGGKVSWFIYDGSSWLSIQTDTAIIKDGEWAFIVGTYDGSDLRLYVNVDGTWDIPSASTQPSGTAIDQSNGTFRIGCWASTTNVFEGLIDEVRVYDERVLTQSEITDLYNYYGAAWSYNPSTTHWERCLAVSIPDYDSWSLTNTVENSDGNLEFDGTSTASATSPSILTVGESYLISYTLDNCASSNGTLELALGGKSASETPSEDGTYTFMANSVSSAAIVFFTSDGFDGEITNMRFIPCGYCTDGTIGVSGVLFHLGSTKPNRLHKCSFIIDEYDDDSVYSGDLRIRVGIGGYSDVEEADGEYTKWQYAIGNTEYGKRMFVVEARNNFKGALRGINCREVLWWTRDVDDEELLEDGIFYYGDSSPTPWTWDSTWSSPSAGLQADYDGSAVGALEQAGALIFDTFYSVSFDLENLASGCIMYAFLGDGTEMGPIARCEEDGHYSLIGKSYGDTTTTFKIEGYNNSGTLKRASVRKINTQDITEVYEPRSIKIGTVQYSTKSVVDKVTIEITDLDRTLIGLFIGSTYDVQGDPVVISFTILNGNNSPIVSGDDASTEGRIILFQGTIDAWEYNEERIKITVTNIFAQWTKRTLSRQSASCRWKVFGGTECGYDNAAGKTCDRSYSACQGYGNTDNFGGFRWLPSIIGKEIWWGRWRA